ncbi:phosphoserine transaminase [Brachybacterium muris]|uniref:phosphoserine transaminase n=1 Tax=Brachybacterium muris TaxID=219301 RepID=UPI001EF7C5CA|nr:phosphoserine transaminase [Brachybacterium muris]MBM7500378.1 phosphoserine aminotransferase [Brachybacterium muris]MCT1430134.1 phosphoserine transaminase [Brachybacterium muris]MCT1997678.1 phosphoserine transaminase [Brachybacterium muris]MCT2178895.1 phosphoserine transaminase [Brachybacterium muris]MCT2262922.1 phosphoserine transaminase [Brachybacterium muris]
MSDITTALTDHSARDRREAVSARIRELELPRSLLPADGRFGSGPSRVRAEQVQALAAGATTILGTSHRQAPVKHVVGRVREGLGDLFSLPEGYEVVLGNGGSTAFWDIAALCLVQRRSEHLVCGEFSQKFANEVAAAPHLQEPEVIRAEPGQLPEPVPRDDVDAYAWAQNETSTGVMAPVRRPGDAGNDQLVLIDATSAAGGVMFDPTQADAYYFAPQKAFASDGGLWLAVLSPAAIQRAERIATEGSHWIPSILSLTTALENSRKDQTLNTPAVATLVLMAEQIEWMNRQGGLAWADARTRETSGLLYAWADRREEITAFVTDPAARSQVVVTLDVAEHIDATAITALLRSHGVVDIEPYRKLGRNQLRIATFPAVPPQDVQALIATLDHVLDAIG